MATKPTTACLVINDGPSKETVQELQKVILAILSTSNAEGVKVKALEVLQSATQSAPKSVNNCVFDMKV